MSNETRHAEVVGAGFAGLTVATVLAQKGWTVTIHEKSAELRPFGAGIVLWNNSLQVLKAIGAYDALESRSMVPPFYETRSQNVTVSKETFDGLPWRSMTRQALHEVLVEAAVKAGVELKVDSEVVTADPSGSVTLASGEVRAADLVIGADGVLSKVRDSIGFEQTRTKSRDGITRLIVPRNKDLLGPGEWDNVIDFWNFEPRVLRVLYVPCNDDELYIALMSPVDDKEGSAVPINLDVWVENFPHLEPILTPAAGIHGRYDGYQTNVLDTWTNGVVALVGDSAHAMSPFGARGGNSGIQDADNLGWKLALVLAGRAPEALIDSYSAERRPAAHFNIMTTRRTARFLQPESPAEKLLRDATISLAKEYTFARSLCNTGRLSNSFIYGKPPTSLAQKHKVRGVAVGEAVQNVPVGLPDGRRGTLVDLFRNGPAFVGIWSGVQPDLASQVIRLANREAPLLRMLELGTGSLGISVLADHAGKLGAALGAQAGKPTFWLLRPDMHLAARIDKPDAAKVRRALSLALSGHLVTERA
jgi:2-methyl-3-hydroxypyridine 5-carboxylic acid dioxygenase